METKEDKKGPRAPAFLTISLFDISRAVKPLSAAPCAWWSITENGVTDNGSNVDEAHERMWFEKSGV